MSIGTNVETAFYMRKYGQDISEGVALNSTEYHTVIDVLHRMDKVFNIDTEISTVDEYTVISYIVVVY